MSSVHHDSDAGIRSLPQCGFGADIDFDSLIKDNRFLFRVYTPKERSSVDDDSKPFFLAPRFNDQVARSPVDLPNIKFPETLVGSYAEVARHMDWTTKSSSPYISTSFSFSWAIWEAVRRYHLGVKKDVEIAIIDAAALGGRAATAVQLLRKSSPTQRDQQFLKWYRFSQDSQTVLVYGMVPRPAVLASIPLLQILRKMPSYFLRKDVQVISGNPLDHVAWDYRSRKLNYRQFCQDMTNMFVSRPADVRLRDSTGGAVRLALAFLRPFFHRVVQDDFDIAISYLRTLAITISEWPGEWWVRDHPEVRQVVESMVIALGEEFREKYAHQQVEEISRLRVVIDGLEQTLKSQNAQAQASTSQQQQPTMDYVEVDSDGEFEVEFEESDEPTLVTLEPPSTVHRKPSSLQMSIAVLPRIPNAFQTPITPPESPGNSRFMPTTITVPLSDVVSTQFSFRTLSPQAAATHDSEWPRTSSSKSSPSSDEPASPPPTPPPRSAVFSPPRSPVVEETPSHDDEKSSDRVLSESEDKATELPEDTEKADDLEVPEPESGILSESIETEPERVTHDNLGDVEETQHDEDAEDSSMSWVNLSSASTLSSRRSSIFSIETLCEPLDFPLKRLSIATARSDSFDYFRRFTPPGSVGMHSRTVSFSEPLLIMPCPTRPAIDPSQVPLPPSPEPSPVSLPSTPLPSSPTTSTLSLEVHLPVTPPALFIPPKGRISLLAPLPEQEEIADDDRSRARRVRSVKVTETASYIVTGFLVGAFITLFLFSTRRRTLLCMT